MDRYYSETLSFVAICYSGDRSLISGEKEKEGETEPQSSNPPLASLTSSMGQGHPLGGTCPLGPGPTFLRSGLPGAGDLEVSDDVTSFAEEQPSQVTSEAPQLFNLQSPPPALHCGSVSSYELKL